MSLNPSAPQTYPNTNRVEGRRREPKKANNRNSTMFSPIRAARVGVCENLDPKICIFRNVCGPTMTTRAHIYQKRVMRAVGTIVRREICGVKFSAATFESRKFSSRWRSPFPSLPSHRSYGARMESENILQSRWAEAKQPRKWKRKLAKLLLHAFRRVGCARIQK